jgi:hypothetical protein
MIATGIAYVLSLFFIACGCKLAYRIAINHPEVAAEKGFAITIAFLFFALAWLCAYLGGI